MTSDGGERGKRDESGRWRESTFGEEGKEGGGRRWSVERLLAAILCSDERRPWPRYIGWSIGVRGRTRRTTICAGREKEGRASSSSLEAKVPARLSVSSFLPFPLNHHHRHKSSSCIFESLLFSWHSNRQPSRDLQAELREQEQEEQESLSSGQRRRDVCSSWILSPRPRPYVESEK